MKKLFSCAAVLCAVALVGCSKSNKTDETATEGDATLQTEADATQGVGSQLDPTLVVEEGKLVDQNGNVIATVIDGAYVDAKGNVIGTVEAIQTKLQAAKDSVAALPDKIVDGAKNAADSIKSGVAQKASQVVDDAKAAGAKAVDDIKSGVSNKLNEGAEALKNEAAKLVK